MLKRKLLSIHKWLGLLAGIFILVMSLTGAIIVFDDEIEGFLQRDVIEQPESSQPVSLDKAYSSIREIYPNWDLRFKVIPSKSNRAIEAEIRRPDQRRYLYLQPVTGEILRDLNSDNTFSYWMLKLHYQLHSGFWGEVVCLLAGLMLLGSLITGFWFYRKSVWKILRFKIRPKFNNRKMLSSEVHRFIGVWSLIFNSITALTGSFLILIIVVSHAEKFNEPEPIPNPPEVMVSLDGIMAKARKTYTDFDPSYIKMPDKEGDKIRLYGHTDTDLPIHYKFSNYVDYNPKTGSETTSFFIRNQPFSTHLLSVTYPLHFGDWGGIFIKILYTLFGIAPGILAVSGFLIWRQRGKRKKKLDKKQKKRKLQSA